MAGRVLLKIVYVLARRVLSLAVLLLRRDLAKDAELLALRHENAVLRRHAGRIRYEPTDWVWFTALTQLIPRRHWAEVFPRNASHTADLAPQAGREEVRHEQTAQARPPASNPQHRPPCHPPGERESTVGLPPDPRRADQTRRHDSAIHSL